MWAGYINVIEEKNFEKFPFKMSFSKYMDVAGVLSISSMVSMKDKSVDLIFEYAVFIDKLGKKYYSKQKCDFINGNAGTKKISADINYSEKALLMKDAKVAFVFYSSTFDRCVITCNVSPLGKLIFDKMERLYLDEMSIAKNKSRWYELQDLIQLSDELTIEDKKENEPTEIEKVSYYNSPSLDKYNEALNYEIAFLKQGKGQKYKVTNGSKINKSKGKFTYSFEIESELYLPDDTPVMLEVGGSKYSGNVLLCEDFQILLLFNTDLGHKVSAGFLMAEPWKLLETLKNKILYLNPEYDKLAIELVEKGPKVSSKEDIQKVPKGQESVKSKLDENNIVAVWGPPGTGKTHTMASIALDYIKSGKTVLIVSHSNVSVDGVIKKVVELTGKEDESLLSDGQILRYGFVRDPELASNPYATSFNYTLSQNPHLATQLEFLQVKKDELKAKKQDKTAAYDSIEKEIKKLRDIIKDKEKQYVQRAALVGTTICRATVNPMFDNVKYGLVMFDEVSMAYVPQVIVGASLANNKFMFVGDFRQLAPIAQSDKGKEVLQTDIYSYLKIVDLKGNMYWHPWLVMINEQRRMHPDISEYPNKVVYNNLLKNHESVLDKHKETISKEPIADKTLSVIDLNGTYCAAGKNNDNSRYNILSAVVSFQTAVKAEKSGVKSVGIITPYAAQNRLIRAMIKDYYSDGTGVVKCATVHQYQGSEADVIIFDAVESYPTASVGYLMGKELNSTMRLINVAITRARGKLITVANTRFWHNVFKEKYNIYDRFLKHIENKHTSISRQNGKLEEYINDISLKQVVRTYTSEDSAIDALLSDMSKAAGRIVVSIPDGKLHSNADVIIKKIEEINKRGVDVLMKSNDYISLPESWKKYCVGADNATFPLIIIDDNVMWYGLPVSDMTFVTGKDTSLKTMQHVMVRIKGKNTIELIKSLSDVEIVVANKNIKPLISKASSMGLGSSSAKKSTLSDFINEKEICPNCKIGMKLSKNAKGTSYVRCSNKDCKMMKHLNIELVNHYIYIKDVPCPHNDGGELTAKLGKYGPYIQCSAGHTLKAEEI